MFTGASGCVEQQLSRTCGQHFPSGSALKPSLGCSAVLSGAVRCYRLLVGVELRAELEEVPGLEDPE